MDTSAAVLLGTDPAPADSDATDVRLDVLDCVGDTVDLLQALEVPLPPPQSPISSQFSSSPTPPATAQPETPVRQQRRRQHRNSTRDRENAERAALRRQIPQLEAYLRQLERGRAPTLSDRLARQQLTAMWKRLAERQLAARLGAESTRGELVQRVRKNTEWIRRQRELMAEGEAARRSNESRAITSWVRGLSWRDQVSFQALKCEVSEAYGRIDHILAAIGVPRRGGGASPTTSRDGNHWSQVRSDRSGSTIVSTSSLPFDVGTVANAAWDVVACVRRAGRSAFRSVRLGEQALSAMAVDAHVTEAANDARSLKFRVRVEDDADGYNNGCGAVELATYRSVVQRFDMHGNDGEAMGPSVEVVGSNDSKTVLVSRTVMLGADGDDIQASDTLWVVLSRSAHPLCEGSLLSMVLESQVRRDQATFKPSASMLSEACLKWLLLGVESVLLDGPASVPQPSQVATV